MLKAEQEITEIEIIIKKAAKKVFLKKGLAGTRLQEIADEAGIGRTAVHYYYRSKENLFAIVWKEFFTEMGLRIAGVGLSNMSAIERLQHFASNYMDHALKDPEIDLFLLNEFNNSNGMLAKIIESSFQSVNPPNLLINAIAKGVESGEMKGDPRQIFVTTLSVSMFPFAAMSMLKSMMKMSNEDYKIIMEQRRDFVHEFLKTAFKP